MFVVSDSKKKLLQRVFFNNKEVKMTNTGHNLGQI